MQIAFTTKKDYGRGEREAQWAVAQRTLHGLHVPESHKSNNHEQSEIAEQAKRRAEAARLTIPTLTLQVTTMHLNFNNQSIFHNSGTTLLFMTKSML